MFYAILAIAAGIILFGGIGHWIYNNLEVVNSWLDYVKDVFDVLGSVIPLELLPFLGIALALGILGLVVKLL